MKKNSFVFVKAKKCSDLVIKTLFFVLLFFAFEKNIKAQDSLSIFQKDFEQYWNIVDDSFGYFDKQKTDWKKVKEIYQSEVDKISNRNEFVQLLEKCNLELYNGHVGLNTNLSSSSKLIPSQTDLWAKKIEGKYLIVSLREKYNAEKVGLKIRMEILKFNDEPIEKAIQKFLPKSFSNYDDRVYEFAVNSLLAGTHDTPRKITVKDGNEEKDFFPDALENKFKNQPDRILDKMIFENNIGYIKINNSLGNDNLIAEFDKTLDEMMETDGLVLDLRETPSGGRNTIGKAILGRFTSKSFPYQQYRYVYDEKKFDVEQVWQELVIPRRKIYRKAVVVLVGHWTGSMGEAVTIGFDAMENKSKTLGTPMAGLLGAVWFYKLNETGIGFQIPGIKLYHVNGTPRELFQVDSTILDHEQCLKSAIQFLLKK